MSDVALPRRDGGDLLPRLGESASALVVGDRFRLRRRVILAVVLVIIAFHYSLDTLIRTLKDQTPLAYLGLVPIIAVLMAAASVIPDADEPRIHDRQLDVILGVPMLLAAVGFEIIMPVKMGTLFWLYRMDLLGLPLFVAGTVALLFGARALWRIRLSVLFLLLAWPLPYSTLLVSWLAAFTNSTLTGLNVVLHIVHVATLQTGQPGVYLVHHGASSFPVAIVSACSGVNGIVGYLLICAAFMTVVQGGWFRRALWLGTGLVGVWLSNLTRIVAILVAGHLAGRRLAIDVLHPFMGLVTFNVVVVGMVIVMRRFGLDLPFSRRISSPDGRAQLAGAVRTTRVAIPIVAVFALVAFLANSSLQAYGLVETSLGAPRLSSFSDAPTQPAGWQVVKTNTYTWATPFFGPDSTWYRYQYFADRQGQGPLWSSAPIISDVISSSDFSSFVTYGIEACYRFHGFKLHYIKTIALGGGVTGNVLSYYNTSARSDWTTLYWHWPVRTSTGKVRYERITLMLVNAADAEMTGIAPPSSGLLPSVGLGLTNALNGGTHGSLDAKLSRNVAFLTEFAHQLILAKANMAGARSPAAVR